MLGLLLVKKKEKKKSQPKNKKQQKRANRFCNKNLLALFWLAEENPRLRRGIKRLTAMGKVDKEKTPC